MTVRVEEKWKRMNLDLFCWSLDWTFTNCTTWAISLPLSNHRSLLPSTFSFREIFFLNNLTFPEATHNNPISTHCILPNKLWNDYNSSLCLSLTFICETHQFHLQQAFLYSGHIPSNVYAPWGSLFSSLPGGWHLEWWLFSSTWASTKWYDRRKNFDYQAD